MRISTFNIWDSDRGMPDRFYQIIEEIKKNGADVLCLQEIADYEAFNKLSESCDYEETFINEEFGLAVFSKFLVRKIITFDFMLGVMLDVNGINLLVINVHLPWRSSLQREELIVEIIKNKRSIDADYVIIAGDFNCSPNSSVNRFLKGDQSLLDCDANFVDLAEAYAEIMKKEPLPTINVRENPRYKDARGLSTNTIEINKRYDRIMLENPFPKEYPYLKCCGIFGTEISSVTNLCASDHYGVYADIEFIC